MKRFLITAAAVFFALVLWRLIDVVRIDRLGDVISLGVLAVTLGLEGIIVGGGILRYYRDPCVAHLARMRADLELSKEDKRRKRSVQTRGY